MANSRAGGRRQGRALARVAIAAAARNRRDAAIGERGQPARHFLISLWPNAGSDRVYLYFASTRFNRSAVEIMARAGIIALTAFIARYDFTAGSHDAGRRCRRLRAARHSALF